jgi:two-component system NtrC family sensor kinase
MRPLLFSLLLLSLGSIYVYGQGSPLVIGTRDESGSIGKHLSILKDTTNALSAAEAFAHSGFEVVNVDVPNLQIPNTTYWFKFSVLNRTEQSSLVVSVPYAEIDELDLYVEEGGVLERIAHTGRSREWEERVPQGSDYHVEILTPLGLERRFLMRVRGTKSIHVPVHITSHEATAQMRVSRTWLLGSYTGIMLVLAFYNLFVYLSIRDRSYLFYVLYIVAICSAQLTFLGAGPLQAFDLSAWIESRSSTLFALTAILLGMEFTRRFIGTNVIVPKLHKLVPVFFLLIGINILIYCVLDPSIGYQIAQAMAGWTAIYLLIMASVALRRGSRQAGFFLVAWTAFLLGVVVFVLKDAGVLPFNSITQYAMPLGSAIEGILLSFGLADRINVLRKEKERSQADALAASLENQRIVREQNVILEEKVTQRTHDLRETNENLKRTQTQLVNAEKMASLGQLTAGIAHEINNPINFITSNIQPLRRNISEIVEVMQNTGR